MTRKWKNLFLLISLLGFQAGTTGCDKFKGKKKSKSERGVQSLSVALEKAFEGYHLKLGTLPPQSRLECKLDEKPVTPCHDDAVFTFEEERPYHLTVSAFDDLGKFAEGSAALVYSKDRPAASVDTLAIQLKGDSWRNGQTAVEGTDLEFKLSLPNDPRCDTSITYEHRYDKMVGTIPVVNGQVNAKAKVVSGKQAHVIQARCGDVRGTPFEIYWYGVPADYKPLMLKMVKADAYAVSLVKDDDCPAGLLQLECAAGASTEFKVESCKLRGSTLPLAAAGTKVRARCGASTGSELVLH